MSLAYLSLFAIALTSVAAQQFTQTEIDQTLYWHNLYRANVNAANMKTLTWDSKLATVAYNYAQKCKSAGGGLVDHNPDRTKDYGVNGVYVGENIYASSGKATTPQAAATSWNNENSSYTFTTNTCASGAVCGHYTQLVWADTSLIGCAKSTCSSLKYPNTLICNYASGGNINGKWPYVKANTTNKDLALNVNTQTSTSSAHRITGVVSIITVVLTILLLL
jgi:uncharacterized protein YkwD